MKRDLKGYRGVTFEEFKSFYKVLFGGSDLERAMYFLNTEKNGVDRYVLISVICRI